MKNKLNSGGISRRSLIRSSGPAMAAAAAASAASVNPKFPGDVAILNVALGLEHQAIAAYDAGAKSKLLSPDQLKIAVSFQSDHKRHRDALIHLIKKAGGTAVESKASYDFGAIGSAGDILKLAQQLEEGAEIAYLTNAGKLQDRAVLNAAVPILEDETRHNIVLRQALKMDVVTRMKY